MEINNFKYYKDLAWLLYKHGGINFKNFSDQFDLPEIIKNENVQRGNAVELANDLEELGPFYIKLGQILSSQSQLLPAEYEEALQNLQDHAKPMPIEDVEQVILEELGDLPENIFKSFEKEPLSAASLGQVHFAKLSNGRRVAVKIQRRDIQKNIVDQLDALKNIATFLEEKTEYGKHFHIIEKFEYLRSTLLNELDYLKEANNLKILNENLKDFERLIVPLPVEEYTTARVLTMDFIKGEKITNLTPLEKILSDGPELANDLLKAFIKQILVDGFFQMDPHPGNVYLTHINKKPYLAIFDLGMVAQVPFQMQGKLLSCLFSMTEGKENQVANVLLSVGTKLPDFNEYLFRTKINDIISRKRGLNIEQMSIGKTILNLSHIAAESGLWLPIQFSMIGKSLFSLSDVLHALDPELNPGDILKQEAELLMEKRLTKQLSLPSFFGSLIEGLDLLEHLPSKINQLFDLLLKNDHQLKIRFHEQEPMAQNFQKIANRITIGILLASLVISAALIMPIETTFKLFGYPGFAIIMLLLAAGGSFFLILSILITDRKKN